jgi:hypothetical protein
MPHRNHSPSPHHPPVPRPKTAKVVAALALVGVVAGRLANVTLTAAAGGPELEFHAACFLGSIDTNGTGAAPAVARLAAGGNASAEGVLAAAAGGNASADGELRGAAAAVELAAKAGAVVANSTLGGLERKLIVSVVRGCVLTLNGGRWRHAAGEWDAHKGLGGPLIPCACRIRPPRSAGGQQRVLVLLRPRRRQPGGDAPHRPGALRHVPAVRCDRAPRGSGAVVARLEGADASGPSAAGLAAPRRRCRGPAQRPPGPARRRAAAEGAALCPPHTPQGLAASWT